MAFNSAIGGYVEQADVEIDGIDPGVKFLCIMTSFIFLKCNDKLLFSVCC